MCLHSLSRRRSSSRKLRSVLSKINALLLAADVHPVWGYVNTKQNPADRPSRRGKKKAHLEGRTREERIVQRRELGSLRSLTVQPATRKRYEKALDRFLEFLKFEGLVLPKRKEQLDSLASEYLEHLWSTGEGRALASDTLAALQNLEPHLKGHLPEAWRLLKVWSQNELPNRAPPLPEAVVHAMVGRALLKHEADFALSLLLGFYGMMRTGELLSLLPRQVQAMSDSGPAVVSLGLTKSGLRQGAEESITITVFDVVRRLRDWKSRSSSLLSPSPNNWRRQFAEALEELGLESFSFRPYSLRPGGATFWFTKHGSLDRLLLQGRWQAPKTARVYINSGLATLAEMKLPMNTLRGFISVYRKSLNNTLPSLEHTRETTSGSGERGKRNPRKVFLLFFNADFEFGRILAVAL